MHVLSVPLKHVTMIRAIVLSDQTVDFAELSTLSVQRESGQFPETSQSGNIEQQRRRQQRLIEKGD